MGGNRRGKSWKSFFTSIVLCVYILSVLLVGLSHAQEEETLEERFPEVEVEEPVQTMVSAKDLIRGEVLLRRMRVADAISFYRSLTRFPVNDERKGYVYYKLGKIHYALGHYEEALENVKQAITLLRSGYLLYSAMHLRMKIYADMGWFREAKQIALFLLDEGFVEALEGDIYLFMARADVALEDPVSAVHDYERAFLLSPLEERRSIYDETEARVGGIFSRVENPLLFLQCYEGLNSLRYRVFVLESAVRFCLREKFLGFAQIFLTKYEKLASLEERDDVLEVFRMEIDSLKGEKPVVPVYLPFEGRFAEYGRRFLMGLELSYRKRAGVGGVFDPLYFVDIKDTSSPGVSIDRDMSWGALTGERVLAVAGPLRSSEAYFISMREDSPPVFYLGQRLVEKSGGFYNFGLKPFQEMLKLADFALSKGVFSCALFYPENGYGRAYRDALMKAVTLLGIRVVGEYTYPSEMRDFMSLIRTVVGSEIFDEYAEVEEKEVTMPVPFDGVFILDTPSRGLLLHSQMYHSNVKVPCFVPSSWTDWSVLNDVKSDVRDTFSVTDFFPYVGGKEVRKFVKQFQEVYDEVPDRFAAYGYDFGTVISDYLADRYVLERSPWEDPPRLSEWIAGRVFHGVSAPSEVDSRGVFVRNLYILHVDLGRIEIVSPENF